MPTSVNSFCEPKKKTLNLASLAKLTCITALYMHTCTQAHAHTPTHTHTHTHTYIYIFIYLRTSLRGDTPS